MASNTVRLVQALAFGPERHSDSEIGAILRDRHGIELDVAMIAWVLENVPCLEVQ